jgi:pimeloyl-ACP methyl ester carboxylesterase
MGGMIAQCMAARYPERLLSLTSIMSSSGNWRVACGKPAVLGQLLRRPARPDDPSSQLDHLMRLFGVIGSPGFPSDQADLRQQLARAIRRANYPAGHYQQLLAIIAAGDRRRELAKIRTPTLVIHGADDPLVPVAAGYDTAKHIAGARLADHQGNGARPATGGAEAPAAGRRQPLPGCRSGGGQRAGAASINVIP